MAVWVREIMRAIRKQLRPQKQQKPNSLEAKENEKYIIRHTPARDTVCVCVCEIYKTPTARITHSVSEVCIYMLLADECPEGLGVFGR